MCGIGGIVRVGGVRSDDSTAEVISGALTHRGPDGSGIARWSHAHLAHRRLAILDLSARGLQPMRGAGGDVGVVFNGAIYNFEDLRKELVRSGFAFESETDTEVIVHGYIAWGIDGLVQRLAGMFAFAVWDDRSRELFLVRDRLGVKPLVYASGAGYLAFASTVDSLWAAGFADELDEQAVADFLEWGVVPEQRSIFRGIRKLPPATIARWHEGEWHSRTYWEPPAAAPRRSVGFEEAVEATESLLLEAVRRRTRADVPIGALLSGGIDSALVCWALREVGSSISTFTFASPGSAEDESADALRTAAELGLPLEVLTPDSDASGLEELTAAYSEPFACGSALGMLRLSQAAKGAATVLLTGDGGDDVYLGYPQHRYLLHAQRFARLLPMAAARTAPLIGITAPATGPFSRARNYGSYISGGLGAFLRVRNSYRFLGDRAVLGSRLQDRLPLSRTIPAAAGAGRTILDDYLRYATGHQFVAEYLTKVDGATMYHGLEARSPFLDHEIWEYASALPYSTRLHQGRLKAVLREIARRRIGERVAAGRKQGFEVPVAAWLTTRWKQQAEDVLGSSLLRDEGWLESQCLLPLLRGHGTPPLPVWYAVVLGLWLQRIRQTQSRPPVATAA
jgi:asparagine synthase (glutamine-hydrolysing)